MNNRITPIGLKGYEVNERMKELMGLAPIPENKRTSVVELTKLGPDNKVYGIVRENHEYYIKVTNKKHNILVEDFTYIGGLQNKKNEVYGSYAKAIKHLNLKFSSLNEAYNKYDNINVFKNDNLLSEEVSGFYQQSGSGFKSEGNLEHNESSNCCGAPIMDGMCSECGYGGMNESNKNNPWAICTASVGRKDKDKYEKCVKDVKKEKGVEETVTESDYSNGMMSELSKGQKKIASLAGDPDKIDSEDLAKLRSGKRMKTEEIELDETHQAVHDMMEDMHESKARPKLSIARSINEIDSIIDEVVNNTKKKIKFDKLTEETKYKLKLGGAASAPAAPEPSSDEVPTDDTEELDGLDFDDTEGDADFDAEAGGEEMGDEEMGDEESDDKPFDDEPFDAGVEADEDSDPKKFIEQLTGKLGQSLRKYTEDQGEPDFTLEKFAINSLLSATHTSEMDSDDQKDIIKKIKSAGNDEETSDDESSDDESFDEEPTDDEEASTDDETFDEEPTDDEESADDELFEQSDNINEMSLNDYMAKKLVQIYDSGSDDIKFFITRLVASSHKNANRLDRNIFLKDLQDEVGKEDIDDIFDKLKEAGIVSPNDEDIYGSYFFENAPKNNMFQKGSNDILEEKPCWKGYRQYGMKNKRGREVPNCVPIKEVTMRLLHNRLLNKYKNL